jgi:hypothetical protein
MQATYWCHILQGQAEYGVSMDFSSPPTPIEVLPSDGWRTVTTITWAGVFGSLLAVAISSRLRDVRKPLAHDRRWNLS